jgi:hypothetical protein
MEKVFKNKKTGEIAYYKDGILKVDNCAVEIGHEPSLKFWDLVEEIVLTTIDGVNLKFGEEYFVIDTSRFSIFKASAGITLKTERWKGRGFSTRELAEEWILMNKPLLSLEDLLSVWGFEENRVVYITSPMFKRCKELAEKKINNYEK